MFEVKVPFGSFEPGQLLTAGQIRAAHPDADLNWMASVGTLKPLAGASGEVRSRELTAEQWRKEYDELADAHQGAADRVAGLESLNRSLADRVAGQSELLSRLAEGGKVNLQVLRPMPEDGWSAGEIISPTRVAGRLTELLNDGSVGWTEKPDPTVAPPGPGTGELSSPGAGEDKSADPPAPARKKVK